MLPMATNLTSKVLPGLATGVLNNLCNFGKDKILGQGLYQKTSQRGGFPYSLEWTWSIYHTQEPLTEKQKEQIIAPLQSHEEATLFKKWGETRDVVECFSLHFFRALTASCVLYNRTEHSQGFSIC